MESMCRVFEWDVFNEVWVVINHVSTIINNFKITPSDVYTIFFLKNVSFKYTI